MIYTMRAYCTSYSVSVHLQVAVDIADKGERGEERDGAQHEEEDITGQQSVAEELHSLQHPIHVGALVVVEHGIAKHKQTGGPVRVCVCVGGYVCVWYVGVCVCDIP